VFRATKDIKNTRLWNPSDRALNNMEDDEAGRLAAFRSRFGEEYEAKSEEETTATSGSEKVRQLDGESIGGMS
jgi:hypothetical protein